eukprot:TRINITY_DN20306_c0_g1_i2.p1 TRINITY_DN20306_c0_g1~~TRINITY_DN20306_c0_g1_i2.p1  ORF type:complete len:356 (+),score=129.41 TRINITY_DN20306_c0_g1_i2:348-1415(+)
MAQEKEEAARRAEEDAASVQERLALLALMSPQQKAEALDALAPEHKAAALDAQEKVEERERVLAAKALNPTVVKARKKFDQLDTDGNGMLEGDELVALSDWVWSSFHPDRKPLSYTQREQEAAKLLNRLDQNKDQQLSFDEFEAWFTRTCESINKHRHGLADKSKADPLDAGFEKYMAEQRKARLRNKAATNATKAPQQPSDQGASSPGVKFISKRDPSLSPQRTTPSNVSQGTPVTPETPQASSGVELDCKCGFSGNEHRMKKHLEHPNNVSSPHHGLEASTVQTPVETVGPVSVQPVVDYRAELMKLFKGGNSARQEAMVDRMLGTHKGREQELLKKMQDKYAAEPGPKSVQP